MKRQEGVTVHISLPWEIEYLASLSEQGREWAPLSSTGDNAQVVGMINSRSYEIQLHPGVEIVDRQVVVLSPPTSSNG
ncbi:hypothetical protein KSC_003740 [Ktedonobacter sp. SOSP1-52]|nr:hypothetical protein KSC_003740 [Ktedonobacter sp. SOSP1-52]